MFDGKAFGLEVVSVVKAHVEKSLAPIIARLADVEARLAELPANQDAVNRSLAGLMHQVDGLREAATSVTKELLVEPVELPDFPALIAVEVEKAVSAIEKPQDGKSVTLEDIAPVIETAVSFRFEKAVEELCKYPTDEAVGELVKAEAERIFADWEKPKDGAPGADGKDGAPGVDGPAGKDGKDGRDGCDIADAMQDKDGNLVVTFTDGRIKTIGNIQGKDGSPGKDGANGKDGVDGVGFDDMSCDIRDDGVYLMWEKGETIKEARLPVPIDRGVWKEGSYKRGESVTWGGSFWIAQEDTTEKPETGKAWRLAVKKGRDGRDGTVKEPRPVGPVKVG